MNILKYIKYVLLLMIAVFVLTNATCVETGTGGYKLEPGEYSVSLTGISFGGDWSHYKYININRLHINGNTSPSRGDSKIDFNFTVKYGDDNRPYIDDKLYASSNYRFHAKLFPAEGKTIFQVDSLFYNDPKTTHYEASYAHEVMDMTDNDLSLHYNANNSSSISLRVDVEDTRWFWVSDAYRYKVDYEVIKPAKNNGGSKNGNINIVVMAEGYRGDQMDQYKAYVKDAFKNTANFHYGYYEWDNINKVSVYKHVDNDLFYRYWDRINVIRMDTISMDDGIDENDGQDNVKTILGLSARKVGGGKGTPNEIRISLIMNETKPNDMLYNDADAYVILVNDPTIWCYTWSYGNEIGYKNGEPIHPVIIQAPVFKPGGGRFPTNFDDENFNEYEFHNYGNGKNGVGTDAIAHELGHAMGRLQDEYSGSENSRDYDPNYRNISDHDDPSTIKWQRFVALGYDKALRHPVGAHQGALYSTTRYYRPTLNSTMNGRGYDVQFGPVNTYYMTGTFRVRVGSIGPAMIYEYYPNEWIEFRIVDFSSRSDEWGWPVSKF